MRSLRQLAERCNKKGITLIFSHVNEQPMHAMEKDGLVDLVGRENYFANIVEALDHAEQLVC